LTSIGTGISVTDGFAKFNAASGLGQPLSQVFKELSVPLSKT